jgi:hypothetical protein
MTYEQYSTHAYTGDIESVKNRVLSNSHSPKSETIQWPAKFDIFTNKENSTLTAFSVTESHALSEFVGSTLYLHHRPATNSLGGFLDINTK